MSKSCLEQPVPPSRGTALVVDDQPAHCLLLKRLLEAQGFEVILASNGAEGVDQFQEHCPEIVFMDVLMPVTDGYEAARRIKSLPNGRFTPMIFLTCLDDPQDLKKCIEAGGDDFLSKPFNKVVLKARILALERTRKLYQSLREQHQALTSYTKAEEANMGLAHQVFSHAMTARNIRPPGVLIASYPVAYFSGDLVLCSLLPQGGLRLLVADFTGHGLAAAICSLPVSEIFHTRSASGASQVALLEEVNRMLCQLLPDDRFMAAAIIDVAQDCQSLTFWSGAMPASLLLQGDDLEPLPSKGLPLGVLESYDFRADQIALKCQPTSRILMMSDGLQEMRTAQGELLYETSLYSQLLEFWKQPGSDAHSLAKEALLTLEQDEWLKDDLTLVELDFSQLISTL